MISRLASYLYVWDSLPHPRNSLWLNIFDWPWLPYLHNQRNFHYSNKFVDFFLCRVNLCEFKRWKWTCLCFKRSNGKSRIFVERYQIFPFWKFTTSIWRFVNTFCIATDTLKSKSTCPEIFIRQLLY